MQPFEPRLLLHLPKFFFRGEFCLLFQRLGRALIALIQRIKHGLPSVASGKEYNLLHSIWSSSSPKNKLAVIKPRDASQKFNSKNLAFPCISHHFPSYPKTNQSIQLVVSQPCQLPVSLRLYTLLHDWMSSAGPFRCFARSRRHGSAAWRKPFHPLLPYAACKRWAADAIAHGWSPEDFKVKMGNTGSIEFYVLTDDVKLIYMIAHYKGFQEAKPVQKKTTTRVLIVFI